MKRVLLLAACGLAVGLAGCEGGDRAEASEGAAAGQSSGPIVIGDRETVEAGAIALPILRAGLWEVTNEDQFGRRVSRVCLDEAIQHEVVLFGGHLHAPFCGQAPEMRRRGLEHWTYSNVCRVVDITLTIEGEVRGNLENRYEHTLTMVTTGPGVPETDTRRESGRYAGACPRGMAAGDIDMEGMRMNLRQVMALGQALAPGAFGGFPEGFEPRPD